MADKGGGEYLDVVATIRSSLIGSSDDTASGVTIAIVCSFQVSRLQSVKRQHIQQPPVTSRKNPVSNKNIPTQPQLSPLLLSFTFLRQNFFKQTTFPRQNFILLILPLRFTNYNPIMFDEGSKFPPFFSALCNISMALIIMIVVVVELRRLYEHRSSSLCWW